MIIGSKDLMLVEDDKRKTDRFHVGDGREEGETDGLKQTVFLKGEFTRVNK